MKIEKVSKATDPTIFTVQFTRQEVWVILRALAIANDTPAERDPDKRSDGQVRDWIAQRFLRKLEELGYAE
jgi:hypothetical protein